jgi:hypothetical protein
MKDYTALYVDTIKVKEQNIHCCSTFTVTVGYSIMSIVHSLHKRQGKPMGQSRMDNPVKLVTLSTQDTG